MSEITTRYGLILIVIGLLMSCSGSDGKDDNNNQSGTDAKTGDGTGDTAGGCLEEGADCDDGDPCTLTDKCLNGVCTGGPLCEQYECAEVTCDSKGDCLPPVIQDDWCLIDKTCYQSAENAPENTCLVCTPSTSQTEFSYADVGLPCQDANICTENDFCDNGVCLAGSPPTCADGIQCTIDTCDEEVGCLHEYDLDMCNDKNPCTRDECDPEASDDGTGCISVPDNTLICGDQNVCTLNDHCEGGQCISDPEPLSCNDNNLCTDETCHEAYGCLYVFNDLECDDGASCTNNDICFYGKCVGAEPYYGACPACNLTFSDTVVKIVSLRVGDGGFPGEALNVDNDLKTCSPSGNCEQGLDNSLFLAGDFIDETITENLISLDNPLIFVTEMVEPDLSEGSEFLMNIYYAMVSDSNPDCDFQHDFCMYEVSGLNFDPLCNNQVTFANTIVTDNLLTAGGSGYIFPFKASFINGEQTKTVLYSARLEATLTFKEDGSVESMNGIIGGAIKKTNLIELIEAIPEEYLPVDPELIVTFVEAIPQDIDLDGDGSKDASSIALVFQTIPAQLEPYYK